MSKLEDWFKSELEKTAVNAYIDRQILTLSNEFQELYAQANECWFEDVTNLYTPLETDKQEYFDFIKENDSDDLRTLIDALKECIDDLPMKSKELINYKYHKEYDSQEISKHLSKSATAIRLSLMRIRNKLKHCLDFRLGYEQL